MQPKPLKPSKQFWAAGSRRCVLYVVDGAFEVRLLEDAKVASVAVCRDPRHASDTALLWRARSASGLSRTHCPRCRATDTRGGSRTEEFIYLRCQGCRCVWRIAERRASERIAADERFRRRGPHGEH